MAHFGIRLGIFLLLNEDEWFLPNHRARANLANIQSGLGWVILPLPLEEQEAWMDFFIVSESQMHNRCY